MISNRKNYILTLASSFGGHAITMLINLISVPISLNYWGREKYGLFAIINSLIIYLNVSNLGLNSAAAILTAKNRYFGEKIIILKRSFVLLLLSLFVFALVFFIINFFTANWVYLLGNIPETLFSDAYKAILTMVVMFFINAVFSHVDAVFTGFQRLYVLKAFDMLFVILSFLALLITVYFKKSLWQFVLLNGCVRFLISVTKLLYFLLIIVKEEKISSRRPEEQNLPEVNSDTSHRVIFYTGLKMLMISIPAMAVWYTDNLVISYFLGIDRVTEYSVTFRLFYVFFSVISIINGAIMPLIARQMAFDNWSWINKVFGILFKLMAITGGFFWLGSVLFFKDFILFWAGSAGFAGFAVLLALGGYSYLLSMANLSAGIAVTMNKADEVVWVGWLEALVKVVLSIVLLKMFDLAGVALGTFLGCLIGPTVILPIMLVRRKDNRLEYDVKFAIKHLVLVILPLVSGAVIMHFFVEEFFVRCGLGAVLISLYIYLCRRMLSDETLEYLLDLLPEKYKSISVFKI